MKKNVFKKLFNLSWLILAALLTFTACDDDDDDDDNGVIVLDGIYIKGDATALTEFSPDGRFDVTRNEVTQEERSTLYEKYIAISSTGGFNIIQVAGSEQTTYGPGADFELVAEAELDAEEPKEGLWRGSYSETETQFTVPDDGLYHVMIDTELGKVAIARVKWGLIGAATPGGWGESTEMTATFDLNKMDFVVEEITMLESDYKFRYSNGWKIILDSELDIGDGNKGVKVNTNLGGSLSELVPGGDNILQSTYGVYKYTMTWELGKEHTVVEEFVREGEPLPDYPEAMYIVGAGTAYGWDEPGTKDDAVMHKIAGGGDNDGIFWKICHIAGGEGFKLSAAGWADPNLGFNEVDEFDAEGVTVSDVDGNMSVAEDGMYMVVLDLRNDMAKVSIKPAVVYGIGDAFGGWDAGVAANLFTVDVANKTITSPALPADGNIRMYTSHAWIPEWWHAEFVVVDGVIEYRNDSTSDPTAVAGTAGQVITLYFDDNTGTIE
ncbi:MAG: SusF/SusE family outer membrane protein [Bacteroidales bacterium]